jgi:uncharacterized protein (TIGR03790 family)
MASLMLGAPALRAAEPGDAVVVIYNSRLAESRDVAQHYAARRHVPADQIIGLDLTTNETMTRAEYRAGLEAPLLEFMERQTLLVFAPPPKAVRPIEATVRYAVLCYGVPLRIAEDPALVDPGAASVPEPMRRNGAAVDSELCTLPTRDPSHPLAGPWLNPLYGTTNAAALNPTNGLLLVARLDGPDAAIAVQLVDKAMEAESNGLWGRAYFDLRGLREGAYKEGDEWIGACAEMSRRYGFETVVDDKPETFPAAFPMSHIALYAGWYDADVSGPFARPAVEFMPGAFAYHLHSTSAHSLRTTRQYWCGPLLADGATATMGCIDEPYLDGTPNIAVFFARWMVEGFSFGEAAYACQRTLSWQTTVIGDPLYRPFGKVPRAQHEELLRRHSKLIEWSFLRIVNIGLALGSKPVEMAEYLDLQDATRSSAVLMEKLADLRQAIGQNNMSIQARLQALQLDPSPQQRVRLTLTLADQLLASGRDTQALSLYDDFLKKEPDYPDAAALYAKMEALALKLHQDSQAGEYTRHIKMLTDGK